MTELSLLFCDKIMKLLFENEIMEQKNGKDKWYIPYDYQVREEILLPCGSIRSEKVQES